MTIVVAIDPGAIRLGYAVIGREVDDTFTYYYSNVAGLERNGEEFHRYKMNLINYWTTHVHYLTQHIPTYTQHDETWQCKCSFVSETQPPTTGGNIAAGVQRELAKTALVVCQALLTNKGYYWNEIPASTVKKNLTGSGKATKAQVARAVFNVFPELKDRKEKFLPDETDAIAIGLVGLGYKYKKVKDEK